MSKPTSFFSYRLAPAWGAVIGGAIGFQIHQMTEIPAVNSISGVTGLIIGYVILLQYERLGGDEERDRGDGATARLHQLEDLRSQSLITEEEYQNKRREILSNL